MKYTPGKIAKALVAGFLAAAGAIATAGGTDIASLDILTILGAIGVGLTTGVATFGVRNAEDPKPEISVLDHVKDLVSKKSSAEAELDLVKSVVVDMASDVPVLGPLAKQILQ